MNTRLKLFLLLFVAALVSAVTGTDPINIAGEYELLRQSKGSNCPKSVTHSRPSEAQSADDTPTVYILKHEDIETSSGNCVGNSEGSNSQVALIRADDWKELSESSLDENDSLVEAILRTDALVGVELDRDRTCGTFTLRKGALVAFINSDSEEKFLSDFPGLKDGKTVMYLAEANVENPKRCVYQSKEDLSEGRSGTESDSDGSKSCFPASANFHLSAYDFEGATDQDAEPKNSLASVLKAEDLDFDTNLATGRVLAFTHREYGSQLHEYIEITAEGAPSTLVVSPGHYVVMHDGRLRAAGVVRTGDALRSAHTPAKSLVVTGIRRIASAGRYNPHTASGILHVDGFVVSCYTTAVHPRLAHFGVGLLDKFLKRTPAAFTMYVREWLAYQPLPPWLISMLPSGPDETYI